MAILLLVFALSLALPAVGYFRAGGDVNYFFEAIVVALLFCSLALDQEKFALFLSAQLLFIAFSVGVKTVSAYKVAFRPYEAVVERVHREFKPFVYTAGKYGTGLNVYLWDISIHGPDVTDASYIAKNAHPKFRSILKDLRVALASGKVNVILWADEDCRQNAPEDLGEIYRGFGKKEVWEDWLCLYRYQAAQRL